MVALLRRLQEEYVRHSRRTHVTSINRQQTVIDRNSGAFAQLIESVTPIQHDSAVAAMDQPTQRIGMDVESGAEGIGRRVAYRGLAERETPAGPRRQLAGFWSPENKVVALSKSEPVGAAGIGVEPTVSRPIATGKADRLGLNYSGHRHAMGAQPSEVTWQKPANVGIVWINIRHQAISVGKSPDLTRVAGLLNLQFSTLRKSLC
ncbi:hypothetical protein GGE62_004719 [Rhizobium leguminosarum]|uniref:hypothetical protein n=1 Tax=Rhizobium leguminosarum TaxID=384 RepID=UPI0017B1991E|nr:hypothetical protein [Rhizobium leguminosarum]MBB4524642.1 hypothetical protein [Rhizobium leguminosarum]